MKIDNKKTNTRGILLRFRTCKSYYIIGKEENYNQVTFLYVCKYYCQEILEYPHY